MKTFIPSLILLITSVAPAAPLLYQGRLDGIDPNTPTDLRFKLYDAPEGGEPLWTGDWQPIGPDGDVQIVLDDGELGPLAPEHFAGPRWFEVTVREGDLEHRIEDRQEVGAVPLTWNHDDGPRGLSKTRPATSCADALASGVAISGTYWIHPPGREAPIEIYCDQVTEGGGWALLYNSILGVNTTEFWRLAYEERMARYGRPTLDALFYDGSLYLAPDGIPYEAMEFMDVVEGLKGRVVTAMRAQADGFNPVTMRFDNPTLDPSNLGANAQMTWFQNHFSAGWSSVGHDGDDSNNAEEANCAVGYSDVAQHYSACWAMNLGADAPRNIAYDEGTGPHVNRDTIAAVFALGTDGTAYTRVRRISRFVRW